MTNKKIPQVLLLGNGINRAFCGSNWSELIKGITTNISISYEMVEKLPFPQQAVIASNDNVDSAIRENISLFTGVSDIEPIRNLTEELLSIPFDHILTTNYSYELERIANGDISEDGKNCIKTVRHTKRVNRAESKYMLHTYNEIKFKNHYHKIWHIHGEVRNPNSVMLGNYYYGLLLGQYQQELKKLGNAQYVNERKGKPMIQNSWLDAFIMGDLYVLGFGYDFSEIDLWWLLNRKKREKATTGQLYFYEPSYGNEVKNTLLEVYGANIKNMNCWTKLDDYIPFYTSAIEDIQKSVKLKQ